MSGRSLQRHYEAFLESLGGLRPETRGTYARALHAFLIWFQRDGKCTFRVEDVRRYRNYLTGRRRLSAVSVSTYLTALRRLCAFLVHTGVLEENPARFVEGNQRPTEHSREYLAPADVDAILEVVDRSSLRGARDYAIIKLMVGCALSEIEIVRANVADLQTVEGEARLQVQGKGRVEKDEQVSLPPDVVVAVSAYLAGRGEILADVPLFTSAGNRTRGMRMTTRGVRDRVNAWMEQAGVKQGRLRKVTPYSLRHTAALLMARNGLSAEEIRQRMRLGSQTTAQLYVSRTLVAPPSSMNSEE
jgi:site-specific recombinase XerD